MRDQELKQLLTDVFGHDDYRFKQKEIIDTILEGDDVLALLPTGAGKSLCYQLPALYLPGITLVVSPLISLMQDQVAGLKENGIEACFLNSDQDWETKKSLKKRLKNGEIKLLYMSPESIVTDSVLGFLQSLPLSLIAIDEAHCVSLWGHEFRADYTKLGVLKDLFPDIPTLALTATADKKTRVDIAKQLKLENPFFFLTTFNRPNISYSIVEKDKEFEQLLTFIKESHPKETGIVYCLSRKKTEKISADLKLKGLNSMAYHAGLSKERRQKVLEAFNKEDSLIIVATIAFGMGVDRPDVRFVAHLDLPKSIEGYYQETGRAGRDGLPASAFMVYGLSDVIKLSQMLESTDADEKYKLISRQKLDAMLALGETLNCRRQFLLNYFDEETKSCGNCDNCLQPAQTYDATIDAQKILSTIYKTKQIFGAGHIVSVLKGQKNEKVLSNGHDKLSVHGAGKERDKGHWNNVIRQLLNQKYIAIRNYEYRNLCLLEKSIALLKGEEKLLLRKQKLKSTVQKRVSEQTAEHGRPELFESLRQLRRKIADKKRIPPYMVFADKSLQDMCMLMPKNKDEFLLVNGVGKNKSDLYADLFLEEIRSY